MRGPVAPKDPTKQRPKIYFMLEDLLYASRKEPEGERGRTAAEIAASKTAKVASPKPSSMARASRTHHEVGQTGKGARRS